MSRPVRSPAAVDPTTRGLPEPSPPSWGEKLEESWPLLFAGGACVALGVVLAVQHTSRSIDHLSPPFLFLALGILGLAGGLASFAVGPEKDDELTSLTPTGRTSSGPPPAHEFDGLLAAAGRWIGRPVPDVIVEQTAAGRTGPEPPEGQWSKEEEPSETPSSPVPEQDSNRPTSKQNKNRLLRLSEEGELTVYSLEDALRDLDLVTQVVHARRPRNAESPSDKMRASAN
jgi:hypothetical protein